MKKLLILILSLLLCFTIGCSQIDDDSIGNGGGNPSIEQGGGDSSNQGGNEDNQEPVSPESPSNNHDGWTGVHK